MQKLNQAYDIPNWHSNAFTSYQAQGLNFDKVKELVGENTITRFYGITDISELSTTEISEMRQNLDMLSVFSHDDPEVYLTNTNNENSFPETSSHILHHPLHSKVLMDYAELNNVPTVVHISSMGIDTRNGESIVDFIVRKTGN